MEGAAGVAEGGGVMSDEREPPTPELNVDEKFADRIRYLTRIAELERDLERERMRLVACGVVACADTPDSAKQARQMLPEYRSAALSDVERRVDECIALRAEVAALQRAAA